MAASAMTELGEAAKLSLKVAQSNGRAAKAHVRPSHSISFLFYALES